MAFLSYRWWPVVAVAVLLGTLSFEGRATAGCGDYVHILPAGGADESSPKPKPPCHGPSCQKQSAPPIHAPVPPPPPTVHPDALLAVDADDDSTRSTPIITSDRRPTAGPTTSVFHPPRA
jgi:hypothetical protein